MPAAVGGDKRRPRSGDGESREEEAQASSPAAPVAHPEEAPRRVH